MDTQHKVSHTLVISIQNSSYLIHEELLHQLFDTYGAVEIIRICTVDDCTSVLLQYQSIYSAIAAKHSLQGRCMYPGCCQMHIQFVNVGWNHVIKLMGRNSCKFENNISDLENTSTTDVISENLKLEENGLFAPAVFDEMLDSDNNDYSMDELAQYDDYEDDDQEANNSSFIIDDGTVIWIIPDTTSSYGESDVSSVNLLMEGISNCDPNIENNTCISEIKLSNLAMVSSIYSVAKFDLSELEEKHFHTPKVLDKLSNRDNDNYIIANKVIYDDYGMDDQILEDKLTPKYEIDIPYCLDNLESAELLESSPKLLSFAVNIDQLRYLTLVLKLIEGLTSVADTTSFLVVLNNSFKKIPPLPPDIHHMQVNLASPRVLDCWLNFEKTDALVGKARVVISSINKEYQGEKIVGALLSQKDISNYVCPGPSKMEPGSATQRLEAPCLSSNVEHDARRLATQNSLGMTFAVIEWDLGIPQKIIDCLKINSDTYILKVCIKNSTGENSAYEFIFGMQISMLVADFDEFISKYSCAWNTIEFKSLNNNVKTNFQPEFFIILVREKYLGIPSGTSMQPSFDTQRSEELSLSAAILSFDGSLSKQQWDPGIQSHKEIDSPAHLVILIVVGKLIMLQYTVVSLSLQSGTTWVTISGYRVKGDVGPLLRAIHTQLNDIASFGIKESLQAFAPGAKLRVSNQLAAYSYLAYLVDGKDEDGTERLKEKVEGDELLSWDLDMSKFLEARSCYLLPPDQQWKQLQFQRYTYLEFLALEEFKQEGCQVIYKGDTVEKLVVGHLEKYEGKKTVSPTKEGHHLQVVWNANTQEDELHEKFVGLRKVIMDALGDICAKKISAIIQEGSSLHPWDPGIDYKFMSVETKLLSLFLSSKVSSTYLTSFLATFQLSGHEFMVGLLYHLPVGVPTRLNSGFSHTWGQVCF